MTGTSAAGSRSTSNTIRGTHRELAGALADRLARRLGDSRSHAELTAQIGAALDELHGSVAAESLSDMAIQLAEHRLSASSPTRQEHTGRAPWISALIAFVVALLMCTSCAVSLPAGIASTPTGAYAPAYQLQHLTPFAKRVLKDKKVDLRELLQATQHREQCLTAHGVDWFQQTSPDGYLGPASVWYSATVPTATPDASAIASAQNKAASDCFTEDSIIESVWILQHPVTAQQVADAKRNFAGCLVRAGLGVPKNASFDVANKAFQSYLAQHLDTESGDPTLAAALHCAVIPQSPEGVIAPPGLTEALSALDTGSW